MMSRIRRLFRRRPEVIVVPAPLSRQLDARERKEISDWLDDDTTKMVLGLLEARHPGLRTGPITKHARSEWDQLAAVNFLNRIAGWEEYRNALVTLANPPAQKGDLVETYPTV
jgi:hypothetical protein